MFLYYFIFIIKKYDKNIINCDNIFYINFYINNYTKSILCHSRNYN